MIFAEQISLLHLQILHPEVHKQFNLPHRASRPSASLKGISQDERTGTSSLQHADGVNGDAPSAGVVRSLHALGRLKRVYCTETRPYNQGARLTAYEAVAEGMPATLITDSMAALTMRQQGVTGETAALCQSVSVSDGCMCVGVIGGSADLTPPHLARSCGGGRRPRGRQR